VAPPAEVQPEMLSDVVDLGTWHPEPSDAAPGDGMWVTNTDDLTPEAFFGPRPVRVRGYGLVPGYAAMWHGCVAVAVIIELCVSVCACRMT